MALARRGGGEARERMGSGPLLRLSGRCSGAGVTGRPFRGDGVFRTTKSPRSEFT